MQSYTTIIDVVELRLQKQSYTTVQKRYSIGSSTVTLIMKRFKELGLSLDDLKRMEPVKVEKAFYPPENLRHQDIPLPDFEAIHDRMIAMGKNADLGFLWLEYKEQHPDGYQQSQFYHLYRRFMEENYGSRNASMPVERIPGQKMYIDWVGDQPELLVDPETGEIHKVHLFTTTLGFSSYIYAEAFMDEKLPNFISGVVHALSFYGAIPQYLVPDNLKTAVTRHTKDELILNSAFADLEEFYDTIVLPPPPRKPKGKATVENHVKFLEIHLVEKLKESVFTDLSMLNDRIMELISGINQRNFKKKSDIRFTRKDAYTKYDKPHMKPLPGANYTLCDYKYFLHVPNNYHLEYDGHYYSVPYRYLKEPAVLKATISEVRICDKNNKLICRHARSYKTFPLYITEENHMPANHQYYKELNSKDGAYYRRWASVYGEYMEILVDRILRSAKHEEQAYNSCNGILHSCKNISHTIVEEAAERCVKANACKYTYFKKVLNTVRNERYGKCQTGQMPVHENIRGRDFYK